MFEQFDSGHLKLSTYILPTEENLCTCMLSLNANCIDSYAVNIKAESDKVGQDGEQVNPVHQVLAEIFLTGARDEPSQKLDSEVGHVADFDDHKRGEFSAYLVFGICKVRQGVKGEHDGGEEDADD